MNHEEERLAAERAKSVFDRVGHPTELWSNLVDRVQAEAIREFSDVVDDWLSLMWCLDQYRIAQAPPSNMGKPNQAWDKRLEGVYRGKGNWFATLLALLLDNRTGQKIRSRDNVVGLSQLHQIDLAWPDRKDDPLVCAETKLTGAPAHGDTKARGPLNDFSNRRKELKFAAADLKLARRHQTQSIDHWDVWRRSAPPKTFFLWGARMRPNDPIEKLVSQAETLVQTYLEGAGIFAWRANKANDGYVVVPLPSSARVTQLDDVLWQIESEIKAKTVAGKAPDPAPTTASVDVESLADDENDD